MKIEFRDTRVFAEKELQRLFLSVGWESGNYPDKFVRAMRNSTHVISAWDGSKLFGLVWALDDGGLLYHAIRLLNKYLKKESYNDL